MDEPHPQSANAALLDEMRSLRKAVNSEARPLIERFGAMPSLTNLAHYMVLRHRDLRPLQQQLAWRGLSSLGRLESRVMPTLDATIAALAAITGQTATPAPTEAEFFSGDHRLATAARALFGPPPVNRATRIMATLPTEAADDPRLVRAYAHAGMDIARINCAHDNPEAWRRMAANVRAAGEAVGTDLRIFMDIAGPKIRVEAVSDTKIRLFRGDRFRLVADSKPKRSSEHIHAATISLPAILERLEVGERVLYNDGKLAGVVEAVEPGDVTVRIERVKDEGIRLRSSKGLNFPDSILGLSPLTAKDRHDIDTLVECADIVGYSFVSRADDIDILEQLLESRGGRPGLGLVAKIERPEAITNLPELIARAARHRPFGVMIARGDLAAEIGFERLAEMQEEILWLCEAASVPVIWATQVLEGLVSEGTPSRGEMTDAAMSVRAECVMLNKGPQASDAIEVLDRLLARMDDHISKKSPMLRALHSW
ncbi:MAG: pyruvate kinase [Devosia sp.]